MAAALLTLLVAGGCRENSAADTEIPLSGLVLFQEDELLHDVRDVLVTDAGEVWVLTGLEPYVRAYSAGGRLRVRFGRNGRGPGEISNPWSLFLTGDPAGPIGIWDVGMRELKTYTLQGAPVSSRKVAAPANLVRADMPQVTYGSVDALRGAGADLLLQDEPRGVTQPFHILYSRLLRLDQAGSVRDTVVDFGQRFASQIGRLRSARVMVPLPLWTTCSDGTLVVLDPFVPALDWYDAAGQTRGTTRLPTVRRRIEAEDRRRYLAHVIQLELQAKGATASEIERRTTQLTRRLRSWFPDRAPPAVDLLCDPWGNAWLQQFSTDESPLGYGSHWLVVSRTGARRSVRFPAGFRPRVLTGGAAIGIHTDSLDVQRLAFIRI